ncbi:MAG: cob(I)yrinic acid a,c-diamide adenosyltransferase [Ezakiella sp.]|nr:cob(I)yrinic acid a,c-diamide adenosyltransferase [Ezakiella sp.]MDD7762061.1 cob(I)yrinic acid a,c-diamide adenosyltransferase [Bacillota bacterium]MDY3946983.1 cob(I)yrinic acid a,c-diamide adenosyltransferase [Ezakiella sp.]
MIFCITGNGKGKTTSAIGMSVRMLGNGGRVFFMQFMKGKEYNEIKALKTFDGVEFHLAGRAGFIKRNAEEEDKKAARVGWDLFKEKLNEDFSLYVLDELNVAMFYELLPMDEVVSVLKEAGETKDIVITGRYAAKELQDISKMVSEINEVKHHYNEGIPARKGIEF